MNAWESEIPWKTITLSVEISGSRADDDYSWEISGSGSATWTRAPFSRAHKPRLTYPGAPSGYDAQPLSPATEFAIVRGAWSYEDPSVPVKGALACESPSVLLFDPATRSIPTEAGGWGISFGSATLRRSPDGGGYPFTFEFYGTVTFSRASHRDNDFGVPAADMDQCYAHISFGGVMTPSGLIVPSTIGPFTVPLVGGSFSDTVSSDNSQVRFTVDVQT